MWYNFFSYTHNSVSLRLLGNFCGHAWRNYKLGYNNLQLDDKDHSFLQKLSKVYEPFKIRDYHTFGCPVYLLQDNLQTAVSKYPKLYPRVRLGVYLERSSYHAGNVALVLNSRILHISPQFHVVFDDKLSTVLSLRSGDVPSNWTILVQSCS